MVELHAAVAEVAAHEGVEGVLLVGRDGLLVHQSGASGVDVDTLAALSPGLAAACAGVAEAAGRGGFRTAVLEWERGVCILAGVSDELLLVVLVRPNIGFAPLLGSIQRKRAQLAGLLG